VSSVRKEHRSHQLTFGTEKEQYSSCPTVSYCYGTGGFTAASAGVCEAFLGVQELRQF
jgi:hypothetical protein